MPYKRCPTCQQLSYSAARNTLWFCPYCGEEISSAYEKQRMPGFVLCERQAEPLPRPHGEASCPVCLFPVRKAE